MPRDFSREHVQRWYSVRHKAGEDKARALAAVGLHVMAERHGQEVCREFLADSFSRDYPEDVRGWLRDISNPVGGRLRRAANVSLDDFVKEWRDAVLQVPATP